MRPAAGVECRRCREEKQHRCQAQIFDDGVPLCLPCANGDPCVIDRVGGPRLEPPEMFEVETAPAPVIRRTPEELGLPAVVMEAPAPPEQVKADDRKARAEAAQLHAAVERRAKGVLTKMRKPRVEGTKPMSTVQAVHTVQPKAPRTPRFRPEELERRSRDLRALNEARGAATRARVAPLLGAMIDRKVAAQTGVTLSRVAQLRKEKGIAAVVSFNSRPGEKRTEEAMDEMREAVKKLGGTMTDAALGQQLGVSGSRVGQLRKELGIAAAKPGPKPAKKPATTALIRPAQRTVDILDAAAKSGIDPLIGNDNVRVSIELTPAQARAHFEKLTPAQMAIALGAVVQASLREG